MPILLIFLVLFPFSLSAKDALVPPPSPFEVHVFPYVLKKDGEPIYPKQKVGKFIFRDAVELKSETYRFGGFSSLNIIGNKIYALSDEGRLLRATLVREGHKIVAVSKSSFDPLWPEEKEPKKKEYDSEALVHLKGNHFAIGFEQLHRIALYQLGKESEKEKTFSAPAELSELTKPNEGIEALTQISADKLLALTESAKDESGNTIGYIVDMKSGEWQKLALRKKDAFRPTELAILDEKHLLLLERSYGLFNGLEVRISLISRADIRAGAVLQTKELGRFDHQSDIDNMEGMDVIRNKDGSTDIFLISDDNFNPLQHTLLVWLNLPRHCC